MTGLRGKRVLVVGLGRTGVAAARCLHRRGAVVTVTDKKPPSAFQEVIPELSGMRIGLELGFQRDDTFLGQDLIVVSPGVPWDLPPLRAARERGVAVVPEIEAAGWFLPNRLVGITGSNGKTTTTALLGKILEASGFPTFVGGNIGVPLISAVDKVSPETILVTELSSFQLQAIQNFRAHVAVLLNITPNHLDRHASFGEYTQAKAKIFSNQRAGDYAILNADDSNVMSLTPAISQAQKIFFSRGQDLPRGVLLSNGHIRYRVGHLERSLLETGDVRLRGAFNLENVLAACAAACVLGADFDALRRATREFAGVEHRLEFVRQIRSVDFYNDSKATSVDATAKALSAFNHGVHLILGGRDKGAPYAPLRPLFKGRVRTVLLIGAAADRIALELKEGAGIDFVLAGELETAVREAFKRAEAGDTVLLSPACASFDQFKDYEDRGRVFKQIVESLARKFEPKGADGEGKKQSRQTAAPSSASPGGAEPKAGSLDTGFDSPESQSLAPNEAEPRSSPHERVYAYEVGVERVAPAAEFEGQMGWAEDEVEVLSSAEVIGDEPLPFEVRGDQSTVRSEEVSRAARGASRAAPTVKAISELKKRAGLFWRGG